MRALGRGGRFHVHDDVCDCADVAAQGAAHDAAKLVGLAMIAFSNPSGSKPV